MVQVSRSVQSLLLTHSRWSRFERHGAVNDLVTLNTVFALILVRLVKLDSIFTSDQGYSHLHAAVFT